MASILRRIEPSGDVTLLLRLPSCNGDGSLHDGIWGPTLTAAEYLKLTPTGDLVVFQSSVVSGNPAIGRLVRIRASTGAIETLVDGIGLPPAQGTRAPRARRALARRWPSGSGSLLIHQRRRRRSGDRHSVRRGGDGNAAVRRIDPDGTVSTIARVESGPPPTLGAISLAPGGDVLFVGDPYSDIVWRATPDGEPSVFAVMPDPALSVAENVVLKLTGLPR